MTLPLKPLELLCPARDLETGLAAINHGADAVYIGAPRFGARATAGNSVQDIERLVKDAHSYWARVYVTLNTILYDAELDEARSLVTQLYESGIDALIIQDMGLLELDLPPLPLFASTQTHNYEIDRIRFLERVGFQRVILARELSLKQIQAIRADTSLELESFVHGALCVSFSGQCYFSQAVTGRSANRGECAQMCRLPYSLVDNRGTVLANNQHLLSLKDLNLSAYLSDLIDAGVTSFKIEGRLKDTTYVKNITAFYRGALDAAMEKHEGFQRASSGKTVFNFSPDPDRSFSRGSTDYFLRGRQKNMVEVRTPKSIGKAVGTVRAIGRTFFHLDATELLHNGDGICFFDEEDQLRGTNVNKVEGDKITPNSMDGFQSGIILYRNFDRTFAQALKTGSAKRKIGLHMAVGETEEGFSLLVTDEDGIVVFRQVAHAKEIADKPESALEAIHAQLSKLGDSSFEMIELQIDLSNAYFLPIRVLNGMRRDCVAALEIERSRAYPRRTHKITPNDAQFPSRALDYAANIVNIKAEQFYRRHGVQEIERGFELQNDVVGKILMTTRHCLKFQFDLCRGNREQGEKLFLVNGRTKYTLEFDCAQCVMKILPEGGTRNRA